MNICKITEDINRFNTSNPEDAKNKLISKKEYRGRKPTYLFDRPR